MDDITNNISERLSKTSSRIIIDQLVNETIENQTMIDSLFNLINAPNDQIAMRAAWTLSHIALKEKTLIIPYQERIVGKIYEYRSESVNRSLLKTLSILPLHESMDGIFYDHCLERLTLKETSIANRAYLIEIILKYIRVYPELAQEVTSLLEILKNDDSPGVRGKINYATKTINSLKAL